MKLERNHLIIGILILVGALFINQYLVVSPTIQQGETFVSAYARVTNVDVYTTSTGKIAIKTYCDTSYTNYNVNEGQTIIRTCPDRDINIKVDSIFLGSAGTKIMTFDVTTTETATPTPTATATITSTPTATVTLTLTPTPTATE